MPRITLDENGISRDFEVRGLTGWERDEAEQTATLGAARLMAKLLGAGVPPETLQALSGISGGGNNRKLADRFDPDIVVKYGIVMSPMGGESADLPAIMRDTLFDVIMSLSVRSPGEPLGSGGS